MPGVFLSCVVVWVLLCNQAPLFERGLVEHCCKQDNEPEVSCAVNVLVVFVVRFNCHPFEKIFLKIWDTMFGAHQGVGARACVYACVCVPACLRAALVLRFGLF